MPRKTKRSRTTATLAGQAAGLLKAEKKAINHARRLAREVRTGTRNLERQIVLLDATLRSFGEGLRIRTAKLDLDASVLAR